MVSKNVWKGSENSSPLLKQTTCAVEERRRRVSSGILKKFGFVIPFASLKNVLRRIEKERQVQSYPYWLWWLARFLGRPTTKKMKTHEFSSFGFENKNIPKAEIDGPFPLHTKHTTKRKHEGHRMTKISSTCSILVSFLLRNFCDLVAW